MAIKTTELKIFDRGTEKTFIIKEMPCLKLQKWLMKAVASLANTGLLNMESSSLALSDTSNAIDALSKAMQNGDLLEKLSTIDCEKVQALLMELLAICEYKLDKTHFPLNEDNLSLYIEDLSTLVAIEKEALKLNLSFLVQGKQSISLAEEAEKTSRISKPKILTP